MAALGPAAEAPGAPSKPLRLTAAMATEWTAQQDQDRASIEEMRAWATFDFDDAAVSASELPEVRTMKAASSLPGSATIWIA